MASFSDSPLLQRIQGGIGLSLGSGSPSKWVRPRPTDLILERSSSAAIIPKVNGKTNAKSTQTVSSAPTYTATAVALTAITMLASKRAAIGNSTKTRKMSTAFLAAITPTAWSKRPRSVKDRKSGLPARSHRTGATSRALRRGRRPPWAPRRDRPSAGRRRGFRSPGAGRGATGRARPRRPPVASPSSSAGAGSR